MNSQLVINVANLDTNSYNNNNTDDKIVLPESWCFISMVVR